MKLRKFVILLACVMAALALALPAFAQGAFPFTFTDAMGREVTLNETPVRVVAFHGSFAEAWVQCCGTLVGTTEDAISERGMELGEDVQVVGTVKKPSLELATAAEPDLILLSTDIAGHVDIQPALDALGLPYAFFSVNTWQEYMAMARTFCALTQRDDILAQLETDVQGAIEKTIETAKADPDYGVHTALLLRAYSSGVKAKGSDNIAGAVLAEMGLVNLADFDDSLLENLSLEAIVAYDPDYIFVTTMGADHEKAMAALEETLTSTPAWSGLTAVKEDRVVELPKDLFHYKPNARWAESFALIESIVYGK